MKLGQTVSLRQQAGLKLSQDQHRTIGFLELSNLDLARQLSETAAGNPWLRLHLPPAVEAAPEASAAPGPSLIAHVLDRLPYLVPDPAQRRIALALTEALDPAGFLSLPPSEIACRARCTEAQAEAVLRLLQRIEPPGLFARSLTESLALQLVAEGTPPDAGMRRLLDALPVLATGGLPALCRDSGLSEAEATARLATLKTLDPRPAARFAPPLAQTRVADLIFAPEGAGWSVRLNPETLPRLTLADLGPLPRGAPLAQERRAALALVDALERRNHSLLALGRVLAERQAGFLRHGPEAQRPLTMRAVAAEIGRHESSVGRMVNAGSARTPAGTLPLRAFFCAAARRGHDARPDLGAPAIARRIAALIAQEPPARPLSDGALADSLAAEGIDVSRRTVARLRAEAGIANRAARRHRA
ncbi:hypothetical protein M4578_03595 [Salipiger sp. P9]|uniref:RNA polymerase factor sigma-54 n=1 Tax=Salipiger pentaromativorans TaxID=2943193 RepID=UPI0021571449|nr:hypothetical protein [Salipiger pentaromativorans]MCR8546899.1 hypothetical protein [Salipiger pentaromativorans]